MEASKIDIITLQEVLSLLRGIHREAEDACERSYERLQTAMEVNWSDVEKFEADFMGDMKYSKGIFAALKMVNDLQAAQFPD